MKNLKTFGLVLLLPFCVPSLLSAQEAPRITAEVPKPPPAQEEPRLAVRVRQVLKEKEPGWRCDSTLQTGHVPLVPSEKSIAAYWCGREAEGVEHEVVGVFIYQVDNSVEAAKWLNPVRTGQAAEGWRVETYDIGDEGYLATFTGGVRFEIHFRSGGIVAAVKGPELSNVKRVAKYAAAEIRAAEQSDKN